MRVAKNLIAFGIDIAETQITTIQLFHKRDKAGKAPVVYTKSILGCVIEFLLNTTHTSSKVLEELAPTNS